MTTTVAVPDVPAAPSGRRGLAALLPSRSPKLVVGLSLAGVIILWAVIGPLLVGDPNAISTEAFRHPSAAHWLGTTQTGQDVWALLAYGTRGSLIIGFVVGLLATAASALFGVLGAYLGGFLDEAFALITNVALVIPGLPLVIIIGNYVPPSQRGILLISVVLAITSWAGSARVLRAVTLSLRGRDYVSASKVSGERTWRILVVEILPNLIPVMASQFVFAVIFAILGEAGLSFLGLGASNTITLGTILFNAYSALALTQGAWWWFVPPGLVIAAFGAALSLINFAIDEIINPRLRSQTRAARKAWGLSAAQISTLEKEDIK